MKTRTEYAFAPPPRPSVAVLGGGRFPLRRIFCVGKNFADHVAEMGGDPKTDAPVFFSKPADAVVEGGAVIPYPSGTDDLHFEGELVIALGADGENVASREEAGALIFGQAAGCDLTRRDLQREAKATGRPWDAAKAFDRSAPVGEITPIAAAPPSAFDDASIVTRINGDERQRARLSTMIWTVPEILIALSGLFALRAGDLIFTGTPAGVGPLKRGDAVAVSIGPLAPLHFRIAETK